MTAAGLNLQHEHYHRLEDRAAEPAKWEYRADSLIASKGQIVLALAEAGPLGWECIAIMEESPNTWLFYKRPKQ